MVRALLYLQAPLCLQQVPIALCVIRVLKRHDAIPQLRYRQEGTAIWPLVAQNLQRQSLSSTPTQLRCSA